MGIRAPGLSGDLTELILVTLFFLDINGTGGERCHEARQRKSIKTCMRTCRVTKTLSKWTSSMSSSSWKDEAFAFFLGSSAPMFYVYN